MSATIKGFGFSDVRPQPGFTATRGEAGGWTGSHTFAILRSAWANASIRNRFAKGVAVTTLDTELNAFWEFLKVVEPRVTHEEGDFIFVETSLAGGGGAQYGDGGLSDDAEPTYRLNGQLQEAPLSQHSKWAALTDLEKAALGFLIRGELVYDEPSNSVGTRTELSFFVEEDSAGNDFVLTTPDAIEFAKLIATGVTTYLRPSFTWTESTQGTDQLTGAQINALGRISNPRGSPPEPSGARDWMLTGAFQEERGDLITTDLEWTLSERGGHNTFLYEDV